MSRNKNADRKSIFTFESMYLMSASASDLDIDPNSEIDPGVGPLPGLDFPGDLLIAPEDFRANAPDSLLDLGDVSPTGLDSIVETEVEINAKNLHDIDGVRVFAQRVDAEGNAVEDAKLVVQSDGKIGVVGTAEAGVSNQIGLNPHNMVAEQIVVEFDGQVTGGEFTFTNLYKGEGDKRQAFGDEMGKWEAFSNDRVVASGTFTADTRHAGTVVIDFPA